MKEIFAVTFPSLPPKDSEALLLVLVLKYFMVFGRRRIAQIFGKNLCGTFRGLWDDSRSVGRPIIGLNKLNTVRHVANYKSRKRQLP